MSEEPTGDNRAVSRRQVLETGFLLGLSALATGCSSGPKTGDQASTSPALDRFNARNGIEPAPNYLPPIDVDTPRTPVRRLGRALEYRHWPALGAYGGGGVVAGYDSGA